MDAYAAALEASLRAGASKAAGYTVDTVYFGGGTPSFFGAPRLAALLETVAACYDVAPDAEITAEANPESARDVNALRTLRRAGFNRVSLGMQSTDDAELRAVGRIHTAADTAVAVDAARRAGFDNLSLDLIYGLPGQTRERWRENLAAAVALAPEHLSCYGLKVEPGTPLERWVRQGSFTVPGAADVLRETEIFLHYIDSEGSVFRMNHASNYLTLKGTLNADKPALLERVHKGMLGQGLRPAYLRAL